MRLILSDMDREAFFDSIGKLSGKSWLGIAADSGAHRRSLFGWRKGRQTIPLSFVEFAEKNYGVMRPKEGKIIDDSWLKRQAGMLGGKARIRIHGNPGTEKGRRLGGLRGIEKQKNLGMPYFSPRPVSIPAHSDALAECIGIILGDGGISERQICVTVSKIDEQEYAVFIRSLFESVFQSPVTLVARKSASVYSVRISRTLLARHMARELCLGNKVRHQVKVPAWIYESRGFLKSCLRGLFDTDGCVFQDRHRAKTAEYRSLGMAFSNRSVPLLDFFFGTLCLHGFHPTRGKHLIFLRKREDVVRYFEYIGSSNPKHMRRFAGFMEDIRKSTKAVTMAPPRKRLGAKAPRGFESHLFRPDSRFGN